MTYAEWEDRHSALCAKKWGELVPEAQRLFVIRNTSEESLRDYLAIDARIRAIDDDIAIHAAEMPLEPYTTPPEPAEPDYAWNGYDTKRDERDEMRGL